MKDRVKRRNSDNKRPERNLMVHDLIENRIVHDPDGTDKPNVRIMRYWTSMNQSTNKLEANKNVIFPLSGGQTLPVNEDRGDTGNSGPRPENPN